MNGKGVVGIFGEVGGLNKDLQLNQNYIFILCDTRARPSFRDSLFNQGGAWLSNPVEKYYRRVMDRRRWT
jgi:hypothetical protein